MNFRTVGPEVGRRNMSFGESIKRRRLELGLTQRAVGERMGVSDVMIRLYEADQRHPKLQTAERFAKALDMDFSDVVGTSPDTLSAYDKAVYNIGKKVMVIVEEACDISGISLDPEAVNRLSLRKLLCALLLSEIKE